MAVRLFDDSADIDSWDSYSGSEDDRYTYYRSSAVTLHFQFVLHGVFAKMNWYFKCIFFKMSKF